MEERKAVTNLFSSSLTLICCLSPSIFQFLYLYCSVLLSSLPIPLYLSLPPAATPLPCFFPSIFIPAVLSPPSVNIWSSLSSLSMSFPLHPSSPHILQQSQHFCRALLINESQGEMIHGGSTKEQSILDWTTGTNGEKKKTREGEAESDRRMGSVEEGSSVVDPLFCSNIMLIVFSYYFLSWWHRSSIPISGRCDK